MIQFIVGLFTTLLAVVAFTYIRKFIINRAKKTTKDITGFNCNIGNTYKVDGTEAFTWKKFFSGFKGLSNPVGWAKDIVGLFNVRKLVVYSIILSCIFGYGYFKGKANTPIKINLEYTREFKMKLNGHFLVKPKNSQDLYVMDSKGNIIKNIKAKDFPLLAKALKPIGFILEPIGIAGYGAGGDNSGFEGGAGVSFIKYWKWKLDAFLTNRGVYLGTSYQITDNSGLGIGAGKGFDASNRIIVYYKFRF